MNLVGDIPPRMLWLAIHAGKWHLRKPSDRVTTRS